ncbi:MAG TPA: peptide ABC transporter ATP-binding protein, partial [Firmicutes bacterium]|nr:peptide ABC transporter ATP-binding protein [Bacillota bacterium]
DLPRGCKYAPRCKYATAKCQEQEPDLVQVSSVQSVRCFYPEKGVRSSGE